MMNQEIKKQWVAALRSGKYQQTKGRLRTIDNRYCCLGVLCDLVAPGDWDLPHNSGENYLHVGSCGLPTNKVLRMAGVLDVEKAGKEDAITVTHPLFVLANMNDKGKSFAEIAHAIEATV